MKTLFLYLNLDPSGDLPYEIVARETSDWDGICAYKLLKPIQVEVDERLVSQLVNKYGNEFCDAAEKAAKAAFERAMSEIEDKRALYRSLPAPHQNEGRYPDVPPHEPATH